MTRPVRPLAALALAALLALPAAAAPAEADLSAAYAAAQRGGGAVVLVKYVLEKAGRGFSAVGQRANMAAVGTIVDERGLVVLSSSIFPEDPEEEREPAQPRDFVVRLSGGRTLKAGLLGRDRRAGLAFLQLSGEEGERFPFVRFEPATLMPGDPVVLVEILPEKYSFAPTFRRAAVAGVVAEPRLLYDLDARLEDAGVGTPAFDARGRAVGLVITDPIGESAGTLSAPLRLIGVLSRQKEPGFPMLLPTEGLLPLVANPPRDADEVKPDRSWLGVTLQPVSRALAEILHIPPPTGAMVTSVWPGAPAEAAGLRVEDVIVRFDGKPVEAQAEETLPRFIESVQRTGAGRSIPVEIIRDGRLQVVSITLGVAPTSSVRTAEYRNKAFGVAAQDVTLDVILGRDWPEDMTGALVTDVETAGWAQVGGLARGDLVKAVGGEPVATAEDLRMLLEAAEQARVKEIVFFVLRDPDTLFIPVKTAW